MNIQKQQGFGGLILLAIVALVGLGLATMVYMNRQDLASQETEVTIYAQQFSTIQNRALSFYKDGGDWPSSLDALNTANSGSYNTGISVSAAGTPFVFDTSSGWLQIQSNANDRNLAEKVAALVVGGVANNGVVTSTLKNPYEIEAYADYLQRMENPNDPSRTQLEVDIDWNQQNLSDVGNIDGESIEFEQYRGEQGSIDDANVDGRITMAGNELTAAGRTLNVRANQLVAEDVSAAVLRLTEIEMDEGRADLFRGDNFTTADASVNTTYYELLALKNELEECMYVTEWCFPKVPNINNVACEPNCRIVKAGESFSTRIRARVSRCQHGCSYSWQVGSASGVCPSGNVSQGGTRNLSCTISGTVPPEATRSYSIRLTALNRIDTTKRTTRTVPVSWENTQSADTLFDDLKAGCYVNTSAIDNVSENMCSAGGPVDNEPSVRFSVGTEIRGTQQSVYGFPDNDTSHVTIQWSGDCVGTSYSCTKRDYTLPGEYQFRAIVKVTEKATGKSKTFTVDARDMRGAL